MIDIGHVEVTAEDMVVMSGGPWAPDGVIRYSHVDGGVERLSELYNNPPEGVHPDTMDFYPLPDGSGSRITATFRPRGPEGLRRLADALEAL